MNNEFSQKDIEFLLAETRKRLRYEEKRNRPMIVDGVDIQKVKVRKMRQLIRKLESRLTLSPQETDAAYAAMEEYSE